MSTVRINVEFKYVFVSLHALLSMLCCKSITPIIYHERKVPMQILSLCVLYGSLPERSSLNLPESFKRVLL